MQIATAEPASNDVLSYLLETADAEYLDRDELAAPSGRCITVRDGGALVFVCAYHVSERAHGRELEVLTANGSRAKAAKWIEPTIEVLECLAHELDCNRILIPVTRPALGKALKKLKFSPFTSFFMKAIC